MNIYFKNMSQKFRLKEIDETSNYVLEQIKQNELLNRKHNKVCTTRLASTISGCISISAFASFFTISAIGQ